MRVKIVKSVSSSCLRGSGLKLLKTYLFGPCCCFFLLFERKWIETPPLFIASGRNISFLPLVWEEVDWNPRTHQTPYQTPTVSFSCLRGSGLKLSENIHPAITGKFLSLVWEGVDWNKETNGQAISRSVSSSCLRGSGLKRSRLVVFKSVLGGFFLLFEREWIETFRYFVSLYNFSVSFSCLRGSGLKL